MAETSKISVEHLALIKANYRGLSEGQFAEFIAVAELKGLNPLLRQIHAGTRRTKIPGTDPPRYEDKLQITTQIDGYRLIARRDGLAGIDRPVFEEAGKKSPVSCEVTVRRWGPDGQIESYTAVAYFAEYSTGMALWLSKPHVMVAKCAEALAHRMAFAECAGLYVAEEMDQANMVVPPPVARAPGPDVVPPTKPAAPDEQVERLRLAAEAFEADKAAKAAAGKSTTSRGTVYKMRRAETEPVADPLTGKVAPDLKAEMVRLFGQWKNPQARRGWSQLKELVWAGEEMPENGKLDTTEVRQKIIDFLEVDLDRLGREEAIANQDAAAEGATA